MNDSVKKQHTAAVILAAGSGTRMGSELPKHLLPICGETVLRHTVRAFDAAVEIDSVTVVCKREYMERVIEETADIPKVISVVVGGDSRMESARLGFLSIPDIADMVAIHDAARCLVTADMINRVVRAARKHGAATAGAPVVDTVKSVDGGEISATVPRDGLFLAHTPQVFSRELYSRALSEVGEEVNAYISPMVVAIFIFASCKEIYHVNDSTLYLASQEVQGTFRAKNKSSTADGVPALLKGAK